MEMAGDEMANIFVGRQPIFDTQQKIFAYELLFRSGAGNAYAAVDGDQASSDVIANSFLSIGIETLTGGKRAFINFTQNLLKRDIAAALPRDLVAIEVLENVDPDEGIVQACQMLKEKGYMLVLDDFVFSAKWLPLIKLADVIKVDFMTTPREVCQRLVEQFSPLGVRFLAEKVESYEDFRAATAMGYNFFQGFFFSRPIVVSGKELQGAKFNYLQVLKEVHQRDFSIEHIEGAIRRDAALSYKLLKFVNSAALGLPHKIKSIRHALALLGQREVVKWVSLVAMREFGEDKPDELLTISIIRAKFAEGLALACGWGKRGPNAFLMGMLSLLDVLMERPMKKVLDEIPLDEEIRQALLGNGEELRQILDLVVAFEQGQWEIVTDRTAAFGLSAEKTSTLYWESVRWGREITAAAAE